jgi:hypothetical protein
MTFLDWTMIVVGCYGVCLLARGLGYAIAARRQRRAEAAGRARDRAA